MLAVDEALLIYASEFNANTSAMRRALIRATRMPDILNEEGPATWDTRARLIGPKGPSHVTTLPVPSPARSMPLKLCIATNHVLFYSHNMQLGANVTV
jgi:hypothetical protein